MAEWEDYYEILEVRPDATAKEIKEAYMYKVNILHPDRLGKAPESIRRRAEEELKKVNRAYGVLGDPQKRREYHSEWVKRKAGAKESTGSKSRPPGRGRAKEEAKYSTEELGEMEAKRLLRKFARSRVFFILPFGFLHNARISERRVINCRRHIYGEWRVDEKERYYKGIPPSSYMELSGNYEDRKSAVPNTFRPLTRRYIVPGTASGESCTKCHGRGTVRCYSCHGRGEVRCSVCNGTGETTEREECSLCGGEGRILDDSTITSRGPGGSIHRWDIEREGVCPRCLGVGSLEYRRECYFCDGTGWEKCTLCNGSGEIECYRCEGSGKTRRAKVAEVTWIPKDERRYYLYKPGYIPQKYFRETTGVHVSRGIRQGSGNVVEEREIRGIRIEEVKYRLGGQDYSVYLVDKRLKFDKYPKSLAKLLTSVGMLAVVVLVVLWATNVISFSLL